MYPKLSDLRALEVRTLKQIGMIPEFAKFVDLRAAAKDAASRTNEFSGAIRVRLGFKLDIRLRMRQKRAEQRRWVEIGASVLPGITKDSIEQTSYSLIICKKNVPKDSPIVRKIHIDYEPVALRNHKEPKPSVHMQMCGTLSAQQIDDGYDERRLEALYPSFEKPRIPTAPTSLALMLNWLLLEFQDDPAAQPVLKNSTWRKLVSDAERVVLVPYYKGAAGFFEKTANQGRRFLQCHQYEMTAD
jgi:hypothetical protein